MIEKTIENWHSFLRGDLELDDLIHEECIFFFPSCFQTFKRSRVNETVFKRCI